MRSVVVKPTGCKTIEYQELGNCSEGKNNEPICLKDNCVVKI